MDSQTLCCGKMNLDVWYGFEWYCMVWYGMHPATIPLAQVVSAVVARRTLAVRPAPWGGRSGVN